MSEQNKSNQRPGNGKPILPGGGKPKFNVWWIAVPIVLAFLAYSLISDAVNSPKETNKSEFFSYLEDGDVKEVIVWNGRYAEVFLTKEALSNETKHKDALGFSASLCL
ncbi:ATP-dependent metallopeptidase FtsH/Yme1/Tma family protein, partial [Nonlabens mediterrranea]|nr:ATP-dependent metallopeptidase FtsH/Yme1/Tma family protein [Nonlabens mediterrranea]